MTFEAPLLLGLLLLPVVALLRSLVRGAPRPGLLATLELLPRAEDAASAAPRRHVPLARLLLALAMVFAVLALARPRLGSVEASPPWRVIVDRSPSMGLELAEDRPRWRGALEALLDEVGEAPLLLVAGDEPGLESEGREPPSDWFEGPPHPEPDWPSLDRSGTWWLTDRAPESPVRAGVAASGGEAVPGLVSAGPAGAVWFDGSELQARPEAARRGHVALGPDLPEVVRLAVESWAAARGHGLEGAGDPWLRVVRAAGTEQLDPGTARVSGLGWSLEAERATRVQGEPVAKGAGLGWRPGELLVGLEGEVKLAGDGAAFALAVAGACDRALWPGGDVVPLAERAAAGPAVLQAGEPRRVGSTEGHELGAACAAAAAALALAALAAARGGRP